MENSVLHKSNTRGHANHGWLNSYHTFSFANYHDPERMHFGALRVLNDDTVEAGMGFGTHPHDNMEIISIPLEGDLEHKDSTGTVAVIRKGDVQVMSAGTGITHSEYNRNKDKKVKFLQIWVIPDTRNVTPRYSQVSLNEEDRRNKLQVVVAPQEAKGVAWIHQQAWFYLGKFDAGKETTLRLKRKGNGVYVFVLNGKISVNAQPLETRDGYGLWNTDKIQVEAETEAEFLIMEVPMTV
jgi:redox-sensitive bicupin YhaK (pirin superfamily)